MNSKRVRKATLEKESFLQQQPTTIFVINCHLNLNFFFSSAIRVNRQLLRRTESHKPPIATITPTCRSTVHNISQQDNIQHLQVPPRAGSRRESAASNSSSRIRLSTTSQNSINSEVEDKIEALKNQNLIIIERLTTLMEQQRTNLTGKVNPLPF